MSNLTAINIKSGTKYLVGLGATTQFERENELS